MDQLVTSQTLDYHPLSTIFPLMEGPDFDAFVEDVRKNGVREPIVTYDGAILDGRNRYRAAQAICASVQTVEYTGGDPAGFVISHNLHRRHLTTVQRSLVAAKLANLRLGSNQFVDLDQEDDEGMVNNRPSIPPVSVASAAAVMNVSPTSVHNARVLLSEGTPEEQKAVESGEIPLKPTIVAIRARRTPDEVATVRKRAAAFGKDVGIPQRNERIKADALLYQQIKDVMEAINGFPLASDAAKVIRRVSRSNVMLDARLPVALQWMKDFFNAWYKDQMGE